MTTEIADLDPEDVPVLDEDAAAPDLPPGAVLNADGSVTLTLKYPKALKYKAPGGQVARSEPVDFLVFNRITGAAWRKVVKARDSGVATFAAFTGTSVMRAELVQGLLDTSDAARADNVIIALLGGDGDGLPPDAKDEGGTVRLPLAFPRTDATGAEWTEFVFARLTLKELKAARAQPDFMTAILARATGLAPRDAGELFDRLDGADARGIARVLNYFLGSGR